MMEAICQKQCVQKEVLPLTDVHCINSKIMLLQRRRYYLKVTPQSLFVKETQWDPDAPK